MKKLAYPDLLPLEIDLFRKAGFDTCDLGMDAEEPERRLMADDWKDWILKAAAIFKEREFTPAMCHAPFHPYVWGDPEKTAYKQASIERSIQAAGLLGIKHVVVHPIFAPPKDPLYMHYDRIMEMNIQYYRNIVKMAAELGVLIDTENMFACNALGKIIPTATSTAEDLNCILKEVPGLCVCFDNGHSALLHLDAEQEVRTLGKRLTTLHLHGNNGTSDLHVSPFEFFPDMDQWNRMCTALREVGYSGPVNLEVDYFIGRVPEKLIPEGMRYLHCCASYIAECIENV